MVVHLGVLQVYVYAVYWRIQLHALTVFFLAYLTKLEAVHQAEEVVLQNLSCSN